MRIHSLHLHVEPCVYGYVDDFLPADLFERLRATFPNEDIFLNYRLVEPNREAIARLGDWVDLFAHFESERFLSNLDARLGNHLSLGPDLERRVTFKLSRLARGQFIGPHTDNPRKIVSLILYCAPPQWQNEYGGGTEIYEPKTPLLRRNWHNIEAPRRWMRSSR